MPWSETAFGAVEVVGRLTSLIYTGDFPGFYIGQGFEDLRYKCPQDISAIRSRNEDYYPNIRASQILLMRYLLVKCDKDIKFISRQGEQFAVFLAVPTHVLDCPHIMPRQVTPKSMGHVLIE